MSRRMWLLAVTGWVGVVIAGSALTWIAINSAGDQVTGTDASTTQPAVVSTLGSAPATAPTPSLTPSRVPAASPAGTAAPASTDRPAPPTPTPTTRSGTPPAKTSPPPLNATETRTWTGAPGFVTVTCTGRQARLTGASPSDGWSFEVGDPAGESVEVTFRKGDSEAQVHATCVDGAPRFQAESGGD